MILPIGSFGESSKDEKEEKLFVHKIQKQPPEVFYKKAVFKNFAILTGKHLYWSLILIKLQAWKQRKKGFQHRWFHVIIAKKTCVGVSF